MLEAERAGAKALVVYMDSFARNSEEWKALRQVQADEAHNCALLGKLIEKAGAPYSHATGEFYDKAVAVQGRRERIEFMARGLRWAVRRLEEATQKVQDDEISQLLRRMRESHLRSIAAMERLARSL